MNCPKCKVGVLEEIKIVPLEQEQKIELSMNTVPGSDVFSLSGYEIKVKICSADHCGYGEFLNVAPGTLSEAKRIIRMGLYQGKTLPSAIFSLTHD